jgi:hypothetical protein
MEQLERESTVEIGKHKYSNITLHDIFFSGGGNDSTLAP